VILRRVIEHVRTRDWTAVALDFVIVVVGVFVRLQVNNWKENVMILHRVIAHFRNRNGPPSRSTS
jgi:hypothetical protein